MQQNRTVFFKISVIVKIGCNHAAQMRILIQEPSRVINLHILNQTEDADVNNCNIIVRFQNMFVKREKVHLNNFP